jgi:hypothetical protein
MIQHLERDSFIKILHKYLSPTSPIQSEEHLFGRSKQLQLIEHAQRLQRNESRPLARPLHGVRTALQPKFLGTRLDRHSSHIGRAAGDPDRNRTSSPVKALTEVFGWMWLVPVPRGQEAEKAKTVNGTGKNYLRTEAY